MLFYASYDDHIYFVQWAVSPFIILFFLVLFFFILCVPLFIILTRCKFTFFVVVSEAMPFFVAVTRQGQLLFFTMNCQRECSPGIARSSAHLLHDAFAKTHTAHTSSVYIVQWHVVAVPSGRQKAKCWCYLFIDSGWMRSLIWNASNATCAFGYSAA